MLLSDWLLFFHKTIIALSGGHFEYFLSFPKKITLVYGLVYIPKATNLNTLYVEQRRRKIPHRTVFLNNFLIDKAYLFLNKV